MRWSQLRGLLTELFDPELELQVHCTVHRGEEVSIGRYWFILDGKTIWEIPRRVAPDIAAGRPNTVATEITALFREYLDTPREQLLTRPFEGDQWGVTEILKAADRRIGKRRLREIEPLLSPPAQLIIRKRLEG